MKRISFEDGITYAFGPDLEPVARVRSGETVEFVCQDSCGGQIRSEKDTLNQLQMNRVNGATGPVEVTGARPGDVLRVRIRDIRVAETGFQSIVSAFGVLGDEVHKPRTKMIPIRNGKVLFSKGIRLPIRPHVGTVGVAPAEKEWTTFYPGDHGGNLDTKEIAKGNAVYLPVFQPGAQLAMGDIHALMADGEVCVTGIEIAGTVRAQVDLIRAHRLDRPIVETPDAWMALASAPTLDEAAKLATHDGVDLLARGRDLPWDEAYMLASIACDLRISQDVDPWRTAKLVIPKSLMRRLPAR
jgi:amidase